MTKTTTEKTLNQQGSIVKENENNGRIVCCQIDGIDCRQMIADWLQTHGYDAGYSLMSWNADVYWTT